MEAHGNIATKDLANKMKNAVSSLQKGTAVTQAPLGGRELTQNAAYQSSSLPQETNAMSSVPPGTTSDNDSYEIVDLKGIYVAVSSCIS